MDRSRGWVDSTEPRFFAHRARPRAVPPPLPCDSKMCLKPSFKTGILSGEEKAELDHFVKAGHLLALLRSRARIALKVERTK